MRYILAYDLGTGGLKASLYGEDGVSRCTYFAAYPTFYPAPGWQEQRPADWWDGVCKATRALLRESGVDARQVCAVAASGHSLVALPLDEANRPLQERVPIWSDTRASEQTKAFFKEVPYEAWYHATGNGDPPETYSVFKLMWLREHAPELWERTRAVVGSKDYINLRLTGVWATDYSYASGTGAFNLAAWDYRDDFLAAAGLSRTLFARPVESHAVIGRVTPEAAQESGLAAGTPVACGGVDNAMMALGAQGIGDGRAYVSLGSSAWLAVTARRPVLDTASRPFVFSFAQKGYYTSGVSIFAAGSAYRWARDVLCRDLAERTDALAAMDAEAAAVPPGSGGVLFNPTLAGASPQEPGAALQGGFFGLTLDTARPALLRAVLEGVALSMRQSCLEVLQKHTALYGPLLMTGGGAKSALWMQIFADVFELEIVQSDIGQEAASLGAAAAAARGVGLAENYEACGWFSEKGRRYRPCAETRAAYAALRERFALWTHGLAELHAQTVRVAERIEKGEGTR